MLCQCVCNTAYLFDGLLVSKCKCSLGMNLSVLLCFYELCCMVPCRGVLCCIAVCCAVLCYNVAYSAPCCTSYCALVLHRLFVHMTPPFGLLVIIPREPELCWSSHSLTTCLNTSPCRLFCRPCVCNTTVLPGADTCSDGSSGTACSAPRSGQTSFCPQLARDAICYAGGMLRSPCMAGCNMQFVV